MSTQYCTMYTYQYTQESLAATSAIAQDGEVVYITETGQICYDMIDPKDLSTAVRPFGRLEEETIRSHESCCNNKKAMAQEHIASVLSGE